jgi:serine/threonine-protein kinase TTK/MPS1
VYSVLCTNKRVVYALKRVALDRADAETYQSYANEIELLKRLSGHDRVIQLVDHQITFSQNNRPKMLMMVSNDLNTADIRLWNAVRLILRSY